jgi:hypothetical protein
MVAVAVSPTGNKKVTATKFGSRTVLMISSYSSIESAFANTINVETCYYVRNNNKCKILREVTEFSEVVM